MPRYVYACASCEHEYDIAHPINEDYHDVCPLCGGELHRVPQPVGVAFKGSGFYKTDKL